MGRYVRKQLTEQENNTGRSIYGFIVGFITSNGYSPSLREIAEGAGIKAISTVREQLYMLEELGKIQTQEFKRRTISLVGYEFVKKTEESSNDNG